MNYSHLQKQLSRLFSEISDESDKTSIQDSTIGLTIFKTKYKSSAIENDIYGTNGDIGLDTFIGYNSLDYRNMNFSYYTFMTSETVKSKGAIFLLHGLNERSWDKYLSWAYSLAVKTGKSVILFPIAFHMNRSPEAWYDSRQMTRFVDARKKQDYKTDNLSFANIAISERLTYAPETFFLSGYQSAKDIFLLSKQIIKGEHELFEKNADINFFGYSFGAFLSEILLIANPEGIFNSSKFFFFCGGSVFSEFNATSKYILDKHAFERIKQFYIEEMPIELHRSTLLAKLLNDTTFGFAFRHLCTVDAFNRLPKECHDRIKNNVTVMGLEEDKVIPAFGLERTFNKASVEITDFEYEYSHEIPFPETDGNLADKIDKAFNSIMDKASKALK